MNPEPPHLRVGLSEQHLKGASWVYLLDVEPVVMKDILDLDIVPFF